MRIYVIESNTKLLTPEPLWNEGLYAISRIRIEKGVLSVGLL
jgi:hypothetical protein